MMAVNYRHIGGLENRLGRHYSRFSASWPAAPLVAQSLARRKSPNHGSNRRSQVRAAAAPGAPVDKDEDRCRVASSAVNVVDLGRSICEALGLADAKPRQFAV